MSFLLLLRFDRILFTIFPDINATDLFKFHSLTFARKSKETIRKHIDLYKMQEISPVKYRMTCPEYTVDVSITYYGIYSAKRMRSARDAPLPSMHCASVFGVVSSFPASVVCHAFAIPPPRNRSQVK